MIYGQEEVDSGSIVEPLTVERYEVLFVCTEQLSTSNKHWKHCKFWRCQFWPLDTAHLHPTRVCAGIFRQPSWNQVTTDFLGMVGPIKMIPTAVSDKDRVGNSLLQTWKLRFGQKLNLCSDFEHKVLSRFWSLKASFEAEVWSVFWSLIKILKLKFRQAFDSEVWSVFSGWYFVEIL